jgi:HEAT repeat protein
MSLIGIVGTAIAPWLGEWAIVGVAGKLVEGAVKHFKPDDMTLLLRQAISAAEAAQPKTGALFDRCHYDGYKGVKQFLEQFFQSGEVLKELQKPLQDKGKPDLDILVVAFERSAKEHPEAKDYLLASLPLWMETFVESYFEQIKGICFQVAKEQYVKQLARRVDDVKFVGIAVPGEEVEKREVLAQIFVMPDVRETKNRDSADDIDYGCIVDSAPADLPEQEYQELVNYARRKNLLQEQRGWASRDRSAPRIPAQTVINNQKKAVVLGAPGSGKTMLASYFALMLCETTQSDPSQIGLKVEDDYLPVVVRIRDWILQPQMGLLEYLRSNAESNLSCKELPTGFFEHWLDRGKALILLDGLDEVVDEAQRRKVAEQIETFLHQYQDNPAVITSRPAGYRWDFFNLDEFPHYTLESFDDKQVETFIQHWYDNRAENKAQAERLKADLQKAFARNERIKLLAKNPLLLTIIALIHRYQAELPRQRYKLYEKAVETLLTSWDSGKEIKLYSQVLLFLKSDDLLYILKKLAYWIHTQGSTGETEGGTLIDKDELIRWLRKEIQTLKKCEAHEAKGEAERFIDFIQRRTGLLNEQGRDRYAFVHKTFQEYLTAEEIFDRADVEDDTEIILAHFRQHLHDQHWREVLLLLVSKLKGKKAQKAIQAVWDAGSEYEQWLHRDLLFAGWCLTEDPPELSVVAADWVGEILDRLVELEVENADRIGGKIRGEVEKILHCLGETTLEKVLLEKLQAQEDRIDRYRLLRFQAALGQEAEAISTLLLLFRDEDSRVRFNAIFVSEQIWTESKVAISELRSLLEDKDLTVRSYALKRLIKLGNTSINDLITFLHEVSCIIDTVTEALNQLGIDRSEILTHLIPLLGYKESQVRANAAKVLGVLGDTSSDVTSSLISLLYDTDLKVCCCAAEALGKLGNANSEVVSGLLSLLGDKTDYEVRFTVAIALGKLENTSSEVVNGLLVLLSDESSTVRYHAAIALGKLGNASLEVVNGLLVLLNDEESSACSGGVSALVKLGNTGSEITSILLSLLNNKSSMIRCNAVSTFGQLGNVNSEVICAIVSLFSDKDYIVRSYIPRVLVQLEKTSDAIRPEVLHWLEQNSNDDGIGNAIDCLWSIVVE